MIRSGYNSYAQAAGNIQMSQEQILLKLYAGSIKFLQLAKRGIKEDSPKFRGENISKTMAILTELESAIDRDTIGTLAQNLSDLYIYMMDRLTDANLNNDIAAIDEVTVLLTEIMEGFEEAARSRKPAAAVASRQSYQSVEPRAFTYAV